MTQSYSIKPSLDNAYARVRRAKRHLITFKQRKVRFFNSDIGGQISIPSRPDIILTYAHLGFREIPEILPILVGEIIYNLRAALDYLIYELSLLDYKGQINPRTPQFIIEDSPKGWNDRKYRLKYLTPDHQTIIKGLQPLDDCRWTRVLRDISDPDKHRTLSIIETPSSVLYSTPTASSNSSMPVPFKVTAIIQFDNGYPVEETLQELHTNIIHVLDRFNPEFDR